MGMWRANGSRFSRRRCTMGTPGDVQRGGQRFPSRLISLRHPRNYRRMSGRYSFLNPSVKVRPVLVVMTVRAAGPRFHLPVVGTHSVGGSACRAVGRVCLIVVETLVIGCAETRVGTDNQVVVMRSHNLTPLKGRVYRQRGAIGRGNERQRLLLGETACSTGGNHCPAAGPRFHLPVVGAVGVGIRGLVRWRACNCCIQC